MFIRAPKIVKVGGDVQVIGWLKNEPVLVRSGNILAATFHPELTEDLRTHSLFVEMIGSMSDTAAKPITA